MKNKDVPCKVLSVKELMEQMGFSKNAPASTREAFVRHLGRVLGKNVINMQASRKGNSEENQEAEGQLELFKKAS